MELEGLPSVRLPANVTSRLLPAAQSKVMVVASVIVTGAEEEGIEPETIGPVPMPARISASVAGVGVVMPSAERHAAPSVELRTPRVKALIGVSAAVAGA